MTAVTLVEWRPACTTCKAQFAPVDDATSLNFNVPSRVCLCTLAPVHAAMLAAGLAPLDAGGRHGATPPVDDALLRACGWPVTPGLSYDAGNIEGADAEANWSDDDNAPPWMEGPRASVWTRLYADAWAVDAARAMFDARGERARGRAAVVLTRGVNDRAFREATRAVQRIAGDAAFVKALFAGARPGR